MSGFVGRQQELQELSTCFDLVRRGGRADAGLAVMLRGRRRVGKSRLVTEFISRLKVPAVYFQAARSAPRHEELSLFAEAVARSDLPNSFLAEGNTPTSLTAALRLLAAALPSDVPSVVVIDELPWLFEGFPGGAGELQRVWDRELSRRPVLLLLLGSDLGMMEALMRHDQPFHGRATEMLLRALSPRDVAAMTGLSGAAAFDAFLITGGAPLIAQEWAEGQSPVDFVRTSFTRSTSALVVSGGRALESEFPPDSHARAVLTAIGGKGERVRAGILNSLHGTLSAASFDRALELLVDKRMVAADEPLSTRVALKDRRWRVADPSLRFWLAFVAPAVADVDRGRPDLAFSRFEAGYASWRGRAIEPVVREALSRLLPDERWPEITEVGGWWPRNNDPEIDLVGTDKRPGNRVGFVGTIKWREHEPLGPADVLALQRGAERVPGADGATPLVGVCPVGADGVELAQVWDADDLLTAWT
ncbi:MAG: ATP-binding protein [Arachnia propionica]|uniref:ATP-binding protein n=1 Tax=Arachnia propionica TaxID=1750 RepID=UPI0026FFECB6|nr:ATP-binding protein [Arachnia propionica]